MKNYFRKQTLLAVAMILGLTLVACTQPPSGSSNLATTASPTPATGAPADQTAMTGATPSAPEAGAPATAAPGSTGSRVGGSAMAPAERPAAPPAPPRTFTLDEGRAISAWTSTDLSTKKNQAGDTFVASLASPIVDKDWVIAPKGARVEGVVVNSDPGGRVKGVASITVKLTSLTLADGRVIDLTTSSYARQAKTTKKKDAAKVGIGAGVGAAIGAIAGGGKGAAIGAGVGGAAGTGAVLATRGDAAVIAGESQISVKLTAPVTITKK